MDRSLLALLPALGGCFIEDTPGYGDTEAVSGSGGSGEPDASTGGDTDPGTGTSSGDSGPGPQPRGYEPRPCGFDLDQDGIPGELEEDCIVCNGSNAWTNALGYEVVETYVDCDNGVDNDTCGSPESPCATLDHTLGNQTPFRFDAVLDGASQQSVVCVRGQCTGPLQPAGGQREVFTRPRAGNEARDFDYPAAPTMVVGWDFNGDGEYPPHDDEDTAVIQGGQRGLFLNWGSIPWTTASHDIEIAHLTFRNHSVDLLRFSSKPAVAERIYFHDLWIEAVAEGDLPTERGLFDLRDVEAQWLAIENVRMVDVGRRVVGEFPDPDLPVGPLRLARATFRPKGCSVGEACTAADAYARSGVFYRSGTTDRVEIVDSVFDFNVAEWNPHVGGGITDPPSEAIVVLDCNQDFTIRNNVFVDWGVAVRVRGMDDGCTDRPISGVRIEQNYITHADPLRARTHVPILIRSGDEVADTSTVIEGLLVANNAMLGREGWLSCMAVQAWGSSTAPIEIVNNTCVGEIHPAASSLHPTPAALGIFAAPGGGASHQNFAVHNNLFAGSEDVAVHLDYAPTGWDAANNVFDAGASFTWNGAPQADVDAWMAASGSMGAAACTVTFTADDDGHLSPDDTCARDAAAPYAGVTLDFDGEARPGNGSWDAGADETP